MANGLNALKKAIAGSKKELRTQFGIKKIGIFGSYARGEQKKKSDLDVLADFEEVPSLFQLLRAERYLSDMLNLKVDLVYEPGLKPRFKQSILSQVVAI